MEKTFEFDTKFNPGDYIINRHAGDMAIVDKITKKGYYHFKEYYNGMSGTFRDCKNAMNDLQINYQKFWDICTDNEKNNMDEYLKEKEIPKDD